MLSIRPVRSMAVTPTSGTGEPLKSESTAIPRPNPSGPGTTVTSRETAPSPASMTTTWTLPSPRSFSSTASSGAGVPAKLGTEARSIGTQGPPGTGWLPSSVVEPASTTSTFTEPSKPKPRMASSGEGVSPKLGTSASATGR